MVRKDSLIKVRISNDLKAQAESLAEQMGETLSVIVRDALRRYIDQRHQTGSSDAPNPVYQTLKVAEPVHPYDNLPAETGGKIKKVRVSGPN